MNVSLPSRRVRIALAATTALVVGLGAAVSFGTLQGADDPEGAAASAQEPAAVVELPEVVSGADAVTALGGPGGDDLAAVAQEYGWSAGKLVDALKDDAALNVDRSGRLFYADTLDAHAGHEGGHEHGHEPEQGNHDDGALPEVASYATSGRTQSDGLPEGALAPLEDTFKLHSRGGRQQLLLDFDGHAFGAPDGYVQSYSQWGVNGKANAWDPAGDGAAFSDAELIRIQRIWSIVSEQFSFLDVDVTTQESAASADGYRLRVVISPTLRYVNNTVVLDPTDTPGQLGGVVGLAYLSTARKPSYDASPALVFADGLRESSDAAFAMTISHEFGHNFGLTHAFEGPSYQPNIAQGSSRTTFSALLMDYAGAYTTSFFSNQERAWVLNGAGGGTSSALRSVSLFAPADRATPFSHDDTPGLRRGVWSGRNAFTPWVSSAATRAIDLGTVRCTGSVRVIAEPAAPLAPLFDARIRLMDGDTVVATATEPTGEGAAGRSAGLGAVLEFDTDPDVTYRVLLDTDPDGASWAGGNDVAYGRFTAAISGEGCDLPEVAPSEPRAVSAVLDQSTKAVTISWQDPAQPGANDLHYEVAVDGRRVTRVVDGATSLQLTDLPEGGTWVRVRAVNGRGASGWVEVRTPYLVPQAPVHVSAVRNARGDVDLRVVHARGFAPSEEERTARAVLPAQAGFFNLRASAASTLLGGDYFTQPSGYEYVLLGAVRNVSTPFVVRDAVTAPGAPEELAVSVSGDSAEVRWQKPLDDGGAFASYRVSVDGGAWTFVDGFTFVRELQGLAAGEHAVRVKSVHERGESAPVEVSFVVGGEESTIGAASEPRDVAIVEDAVGTRLTWREPARLRGASVRYWLVTVGGRQVSVPVGQRRLELTGLRQERAVVVSVAAVTERGGLQAVGETARVTLAPAP